MNPTTIRSLACMAVLSAATTLAHADPLPANRDIHIEVANDAGARYGSGENDTYWLNAPGGGLNQLHIANTGDAAGVQGQVTAKTIDTASTSGSFWVTTTGGRGYNDDLVLAFSMTGPISDSFSLKLKSSGYQWDAGASLPGSLTHVDGAVNETFTQADFLYGPHTAKPGPGNAWVLPFWSGQDINDPATASWIMFIDLNVGNISDRSSIDAGSAKVEFELEGLYGTTAAFNAYAWALNANVANSSINWTNRLSTNPLEAGQSGYSITSTAVAPVPEPETAVLMLSGLAALGWFRRRRQIRG
jgi:hypothetical protein